MGDGKMRQKLNQFGSQSSLTKVYLLNWSWIYVVLHTGFNLWNQRKSDRKKVNCKALVSFHDPSKIMLPPHLTSQVSASFYTITWLSSTINCSCDMWEYLAQRFWYGSLKYNKIMRHKKAPVLEKCVCHLWLLLGFKPKYIWEMKQHIFCCLHAKRTFLLCCYLEDRKWVTCLNYLFSGLIASVPSNWIVWETLWLKTKTLLEDGC